MYLDPGFGSMIIQIIVGVVAGGGAILFMLRRRIAKLFGKDIPDPVDDDELDEQEALDEDDDLLDDEDDVLDEIDGGQDDE